MYHQCIHVVHLFLRLTLASQSRCVWTSYEIGGFPFIQDAALTGRCNRVTELDIHGQTNTVEEMFWFRLAGYRP